MLRFHMNTQCEPLREGLEDVLCKLLEKLLVHMRTTCYLVGMKNVSEETRAGKLQDENQRHSP